MNKVRMGIVGIGNMGSSHSKNIAAGKMVLRAKIDMTS